MSTPRVKTNPPQVDLMAGTADGSWIAVELKVLKKGAAEAGKTKASAQAFLRKHGFVTKTGKLTKPYQG